MTTSCETHATTEDGMLETIRALEALVADLRAERDEALRQREEWKEFATKGIDGKYARACSERDALADRLAQAEAAVRDWISEVERMDRVANGWQEEAFAAGRRADRLRLRLARVCMWGWSQRAPWRNPGVWSGRVAAPPGDGR